MATLSKLAHIFNNYKILISLGTFFAIYKALFLLQIEIKPVVYQIAMLIGTFVVYNQNKIIPEKNSLRLNFSKSNKHLPFTISLIFISLTIFLIFTYRYGFRREILLVVLFLPSFFYQIPIISYHGKYISVRKMPYFKIFLISFVWAFVSSLMIFVTIDSIEFMHSLWILLLNFIFILSITIPFDVRDKIQDKRNELKTLSHIFGDSQLIVTSIILSIINYLASVMYIININKSIYIIAESAMLIYLLAIFSLFKKLKNKDYYYELLDFSILLYGLFYLICWLLR